MSQSSKHQEYKYSMKTAAASYPGDFGGLICHDQILFWLVPPRDAISIQYLRTHLKFQFDASVAVGDRIIESIGIVDRFTDIETSLPSFKPNYLNLLRVDQAADGNRNVELDINLTSLLKKDNVAYVDNVLGITSADTGLTLVLVKFPSNLRENLNVGDIRLWKTDGLFTTTGIV